jgi:ATP-dependent RNA helicase DDX47/RRP3
MKNSTDELNKENIEREKSFKDLGLVDQLCESCDRLNFKVPTEIQCQAIPYALEKRDIIGLAQTGSGKTAAFGLPILQALLDNPQPLFACILAPTRELAFQISEHMEALGHTIGVRSIAIVGGVEMIEQAIALSKKPHIIVCTPGRLVDHLENTKGFNLSKLKYLVMDEADRLLTMDFEKELETILKVVPTERHTMLFSATMTDKVAKLQRASLKNPVKVSVSTKYSTVDTLLQNYIFIPLLHKNTYLTYIVNELCGNSIIIFTSTCNSAQSIALMLRNLGFAAVSLHGQMTQPKRLGALNKFSSGSRTILVATDVASRGLDLPKVDCVINFDIPTNSKTYVHRVGRTARAGKSGKAITFVTQYDIEVFQRLENLLGKQMEQYSIEKEKVMVLHERVSEANRMATMQLKELENEKKDGKKRGGGRFRDRRSKKDFE